jgi:hypothetical protein
MSGHPRLHRSSRQLLLPAVAFLLVMGLFSAGPAAAHNFTKTDPDDTRGLLDLRSASVAHTSNAVVHSFRTFAGWAPRDLGRLSSFFVIGLDRNNDASQAERCVLVYYRSGLRATLFNCITGATIGQVPLSKPNRTTVKVTIPKAQTGLSYRWSIVSIYVEKKPCLNGCFDGIPNLSGFILHDLIPPTVSMNTDPLRVWEADTDATFNFPFSVSDTGGAGVATWRIQKREPGGVWEDTGVSGTGGGAKNPPLPGEEGTRNRYRVVVVDKHANRTNGPSRLVYIPTDDDDLDPDDFSTPPISTSEALAFGGTYSLMAASDVFTYEFTPPPGDCLFELVGPGAGDWSVSVVAGEGNPEIVAAPGGGQRQTLYTDDSCAATYEVTVDSGSGFAIDAVLGTSVP